MADITHDTKDTSEKSTLSADIFADLEATLDEVAEANPRIDGGHGDNVRRETDLRAILEVSLAVNSSLEINEVLEMVMRKAVELMQAERGLIMLLDEQGELQVKTGYNLCKEQMMEEDFRISNSTTSQVASTGKAVYTSDAMADDRYSNQQSVVELHLRLIMCVPLMIKGTVIGVIYLDNSNQTKMFLKSDLYLFELYAQIVSNALHNANIFDSLKRLQRFNQSIVANSPVGIVVIDNTGRIASVNTVGLEILDLDRDNVRLLGFDLNPTRFLDIIPESERGRWRTMINIVLTTWHEYSDARYYHNTGYLEKVLSLKISPVSNLPNGSDGLIMTMEDATEKVTMEQYVILSEKLVARGEMAASVAHELNNYLAIIANNAELMSLNIDREKFDKVKFNSKSIVENIFKIKRFVDSLMDFSNPEPEYISYDIKRLIDDLLFSMRIQPRLKLIHFTIDMTVEIPNLEIDVGQVQQVLMNLLNNAADAIEDHASKQTDTEKQFSREIGVTAAFDAAQDKIVVQIRDNGIGMSNEVRAKIFTLHFSTKKGGHGLGLYNCVKIVKQHGGTLTVDSVAGQGSTFTLVLPRFHPQTQNAKV
ncbi:MAG: ATP-binding protein [candidate division Zixibacteria bacterium]|nr:ATP-binding protein [candidate division Zixibacteria bacterium]